jgi:hypothetical protein
VSADAPPDGITADAELWNGIVRWGDRMVWVADGRLAHLVMTLTDRAVWCGADVQGGEVAEYPPCPSCVTRALNESPLDSALWRWFRRTRGENSAPTPRWCSTCGSHLREAGCPRCD